VSALTVFDDGSGSALYSGGHFTTAGGVVVNNVAKWNGTQWSALGSGLGIPGCDSCGYVLALAVFDDGSGPALYAGGLFTASGGEAVNSIAKWTGTRWSALGTGLGGSVNAFTVFDDGGGSALYLGGVFTHIGGERFNYVAKWDGTRWFHLGSGMDGQYPSVLALTVFDEGSGPALYAGGGFTTAGGVAANFIARWDGAQWSALSSEMDSSVRALTVFDEGSGPALYAGGGFTTAGGMLVNNIAKWSGTQWWALSGGMNRRVNALTVFDNRTGPALYAGGEFTTAGDSASSRIAAWRCPMP